MSLLAHLSNKLVSQQENLATEALGYILARSPEALRAFVDHALGREVGLDVVSIQTQSTMDDAARPDLTGTNSEGLRVLLVEAKFWAGLTSSQPVAYLRQTAAGGALVVVAPASRVSYLWPELERRIQRAGLEVLPERSSPSVRRARVESRLLVLVDWSTTLGALEHAASGSLREDVRQLQALCAHMDHSAFMPVHAEELTSKAARRVYEFGHIVDAVAKALGPNLDRKGLKASSGNGWYGRYARLYGANVLLHVGVQKWMNYAPTPLWLTVFGAKWQDGDPDPVFKMVKAYDELRPGSVFRDHARFPTVALWVPTGAVRDDVIDDVCGQIRQLRDVLTSVAAPPSALASGPAEGETEE